MSPVEIERKLRQIDNDVQSIYTMLSAIQGTQERHTNRLGELAVKADSLDSKVDGLDTGLTSLETQVGSVETQLSTLDSKIDSVLELLRAGPLTQG